MISAKKTLSVAMSLTLCLAGGLWAEKKPAPKKKRPGMFKRIDRNFDNHLSKNEYMSFYTDHFLRQFGEMDKDGDGKLTRKEWKEAIQRRRANFKKRNENKKKKEK